MNFLICCWHSEHAAAYLPWTSGEFKSERSTRESPAMQVPAPTNCQKEYLVPSANLVRSMTQGIVQQSNKFMLVMYEYWYALIAATQVHNDLQPSFSCFTWSYCILPIGNSKFKPFPFPIYSQRKFPWTSMKTRARYQYHGICNTCEKISE